MHEESPVGARGVRARRRPVVHDLGAVLHPDPRPARGDGRGGDGGGERRGHGRRGAARRARGPRRRPGGAGRRDAGARRGDGRIPGGARNLVVPGRDGAVHRAGHRRDRGPHGPGHRAGGRPRAPDARAGAATGRAARRLRGPRRSRGARADRRRAVGVHPGHRGQRGELPGPGRHDAAGARTRHGPGAALRRASRPRRPAVPVRRRGHRGAFPVLGDAVGRAAALVVRLDAAAARAGGIVVVLSSVGIAVFQVPFARFGRTATTAARTAVVSGVVLAASCLLLATTSGGGGAGAVTVVVLAAVLHVVGELSYVAANWGLSVRLMREEAKGAYQGASEAATATVQMVGPAVFTLAVGGLGALGWVLVAGVFLVAVAPIPRLTRWAVRTREPALARTS